MNAQNPRQFAIEILRQRRPGGEFTEDLLDRTLAQSRLSSVDRALCQELVYGVARWQTTLDWLIIRKTDGRKQSPVLENLLRLGLYQIFWLTKIPPHAAVHESVEIAKRLGLGPQAGFVNAVLRGYLRESDETMKILADLKNSNPAVGFSHQRWLVEKWRKRFGAQKLRQLLEWNNLPPKTFARLNTLKTDAGKLLEKWREENVECDFVRPNFLGMPDWRAGQDAQQRVSTENLIFELKSHPPLNSLQSFHDGWFYVQDPSTLLAVMALAPQPGEMILDLCAAPGGKTTFIAQVVQNEGKIVAGDISDRRLELIRENCQRLGVKCAETFLICETSQSAIGSQQFDKILIDAPCSNTGVMRRRVDLRWRIRQGELARLQRAQLDLLNRAAPMLKPGGILVYSTCSLEPEENQNVMKQFLDRRKEFKLESERELLPFVDQVDGAFVARLKRLP